MATVNIPWDTGLYNEKNHDWQGTWPEMPTIGEVIQLDPVTVVSGIYIPEGIAHHAFIEGWEEPVAQPVIVGPRVLELAQKLGLTEAEIELRNQKVKKLELEGPKHIMSRLAKDAPAIQRATVVEALPVFVAYTHAACGGELRYHKSMKPGYLPSDRKAAWVAWRGIWEKYGNEALEVMTKLFRSMPSGSIGGKKWAVASETLLWWYEGKLGPTQEANDKIFVDRVLAMEHNGGCFLNKREWLNTRKGRTDKIGSYKVSSLHPAGAGMTTILNCHASDPPNLDGLYACAAPPVQKMLYDYLEAAKAAGLKIVGNWNPPDPNAIARVEAKAAWPKEAKKTKKVAGTIIYKPAITYTEEEFWVIVKEKPVLAIKEVRGWTGMLLVTAKNLCDGWRKASDGKEQMVKWFEASGLKFGPDLKGPSGGPSTYTGSSFGATGATGPLGYNASHVAAPKMGPGSLNDILNGNFNVVFKVTKIHQYGGTFDADIVQTYPLDSKTLSPKKFYFAHMIKAVHPGAKVVGYDVWVENSNYKSPVHSVSSKLPIGAITGQNLIVALKTEEKKLSK